MPKDLFQLVRSCSDNSKHNLTLFLNKLCHQSENINPSKTENKLVHIFQQVTSKITMEKAREISKSQRYKKSLSGNQFNYGEITFLSIYRVIQTIKNFRTLDSNDIFYDLGSGSGKVLLAAALTHPFKQCNGIEILQSLHKEATQLVLKVEQERKQIQQKVKEIHNEYYEIPKLQAYNQDFKVTDWSDGTVIFVSSTCYSRELMYQIEQLTKKLCIGAIMITLTRKVETNIQWKVLEVFDGDTSWGSCKIYIQIKES